MSPSSLDLPWAISLTFKGLNHCVDQRELFGTDTKFSLFRPPFAWPEGLTFSPPPPLSIGEKNRSFKGLNLLNSFSSLSSLRDKRGRRSWQVGPPCQRLSLGPIGSFLLIRLLNGFGSHEPHIKVRCGSYRPSIRITKGSAERFSAVFKSWLTSCMRLLLMSQSHWTWVPFVRFSLNRPHPFLFFFFFSLCLWLMGPTLSVGLFTIPGVHPRWSVAFALLPQLCASYCASRTCFIFIKLNIWRYVVYFISKFMVF